MSTFFINIIATPKSKFKKAVKKCAVSPLKPALIKKSMTISLLLFLVTVKVFLVSIKLYINK